MGVEPDRPSVSVAPVVDSKVAAPEVQLSSWDPAANVSGAADAAQGSLCECMGSSSLGQAVTGCVRLCHPWPHVW